MPEAALLSSCLWQPLLLEQEAVSLRHEPATIVRALYC